MRAAARKVHGWIIVVGHGVGVHIYFVCLQYREVVGVARSWVRTWRSFMITPVFQSCGADHRDLSLGNVCRVIEITSTFQVIRHCC